MNNNKIPTIDSRTVQSPSSAVFYALTGRNRDGHDYVCELYGRGVRNFVISRWRPEFNALHDAEFTIVDDTVAALQHSAARHRAALPKECEVVGITGSNGKTVVKEWISQLLSDDPNLYRSPRSYNSQIGVPLSVSAIPETADIALIEAGMSYPGEMGKLAAVIRPDVGIFTHLGEAHAENFKSDEEKLKEKCLLFGSCHTVICRDTMAERIRPYLSDGCKLFTWNEKSTNLKIPFDDEASAENCRSAAAYLLYRGVPEKEIKERVTRLQPVAMRMEIKEGVNGCTLIKDYYNSDPESFNLAVDTLSHYDKTGNRVVILSDFVDIARDGAALYGEVASQIQRAGVSLFIGIGPKLCANRGLFTTPQARFYSSADEFARSENRDNFRDMTILIKGARDFRLEVVAGFLQKQSHTTLLRVDLDAMAHNVECYRSILPRGVKMAVMVKAFTYGSGSFETAAMLQDKGVDYLMVAYSDEGVELRIKGITVPIAVMNPEPESFGNIIEFSLEPEIYSLDLLDGFDAALKKHGIKDYPVHLKLNTGMNRSGLDEADLRRLFDFYSVPGRASYIKSVFSHLAVADEPSEDEFTMKQIGLFQAMSEKIQSRFPQRIIRHILNSAGIERFPQFSFEMVRLGIGLHGFSPLPSGYIAEGNKLPELLPVSTLVTHIASVRDVMPGATIGYGRRGVVKKPSTIAVIPVGYADGLNRRLGCGVGECFLRGRRVPTIGNICMDACMLDVTDTGAAVGDEVEIFGRNIPVTELSDKTGTIPYEIITGISRRVQRIYYREH